MGKGTHGKSSASAGTRKKHAKKHAPPPEEPVPKTKKGKKERGKKEPRQKIYIPPVKPAPVQPDPLETTGLAHSLPAELLIILRSFNKKAEVTKIRALEELQAGWVDKCPGDEVMEYTVLEMLPVWLHHVSALFLHPSRRVRALTATLHLSLLQIAAVKEQIFFFLQETASTSQAESILGSWCVAANDIDRTVATVAMKSWNEAIGKTPGHLALDESSVAALAEFVQRTALDPAGIYAYLNPVQPSFTPVQSHPGSRKGSGRSTPAVQPRKQDPDQLSRNRPEEAEESDQDRKARLRFGALGAIKWTLESLEKIPETLFKNPAFLSCLQPRQFVSWLGDMESFGYTQPVVRKNMWTLLQVLFTSKKGALQEFAAVLARAILRSAFVEHDSNVQSAMWYPLLLFLKEFPESWELEIKANQEDLEDESEDEEVTEPSSKAVAMPSLAYREFLQFLQNGCSGSPIQGYPTVVVILSTISSSIIASSSPTPLEDLFASFWAALDKRALSSLNRAASAAAFLSSLLECMILVIKRVRSPSATPQNLAKLLHEVEGEVDVEVYCKKLVTEQVGKVWQEVQDGRLKLENSGFAKCILRTVESLREIDTELSILAWETLANLLLASAPTHPRLVPMLVKSMQTEAQGSSQDWSVKLTTVISRLAEEGLVGLSESGVSSERQQLLAELLDTFREDLFSLSGAFRDKLDDALLNQPHKLMNQSSAVFLSTLMYRGQDGSQGGADVARKAWSSILVSLAEDEGPGQGTWFKVLVDTAQAAKLPACLKLYEQAEDDGETGVLDDVVRQRVKNVLSGTANDVIQKVLVYHEYFISNRAFHGIFEMLCTELKKAIITAFKDPTFADGDEPSTHSTSAVDWSSFERLLSLVLPTYDIILKSRPADSTAVDSLASEAFLFAYLLPLCEEITDEQGNLPGKKAFEMGAKLWSMWFSNAMEVGKGAETGHSKASLGLKDVRRRIKGLVVGTKTRVLPQTVIRLLLSLSGTGTNMGSSFFNEHPEFSTETAMRFLPTVEELDSMLASLMSGISAHPSMGVLEPIVPPPTAYPYSLPVKVSSSLSMDASEDEFGDIDVSGYDRYGYSAYARAVCALVSVFAQDRAIAKSREGVEFLRHFGALEVCAWDGICAPSTLGGGETAVQKVFGERVPIAEGVGEVLGLAELITRIEQVTTYVLLTAGKRQPWKRYLMDSLPLSGGVPSSTGSSSVGYGGVDLGGVQKTAHASMNALSNFALDVIGRAVQSEMDLKAGVVFNIGTPKEQVRASKNKTILFSRVLKRVMERLSDDADSDDQEGVGLGKEELDVWVSYARKVQRVAPLTAATILSTITALGVDCPKLDRARNEFAASLLGIPPAKANYQGLDILRDLGGCVPYEEVDDVSEVETRLTSTSSGLKAKLRGARRGGSDVIMLPVQRAVNVARACQQWVEGNPKAASDDQEDEDDEEDGPSEDLEGAMLAVFIGLAPILQNVPGKHWDFMWDVAETVLENTTFEDAEALLGLSHALRFVRVMEDLVRTNKQLRAEWDRRRTVVLGHVRDLLLDEDEESVVRVNSVPRSVCRELVLSIVQHLPEELIDKDTLGKMCHLVADPSIEVQRLAYGMLKQAAEKRTEWVVIEVGVGTLGKVEGGEDSRDSSAVEGGTIEGSPIPDVPGPQPVPAAAPIVEKKVGRRKDGRIRRKRVKVVKDEGPSLLPRELVSIIESDAEGDPFGWMLGWMLLFDLFNNASYKVKSMYIEQLRNLGLVTSRFMPFIVHQLHLDEGSNKAVKVEMWAVDEFYISYYEPQSTTALAAHLYFRALLSVPSLIVAWVNACKDRQLNNAITNMTSQHFSPLIIRSEVAHLKSPEAMAELTGDGVSVKVVGGNSEVVAAYVVDEHQLEIKLKIPPDWPLHHIEVRDEKRVGVDENRWRAWVLGVQQTIWTNNGRIVDGLSLWKKNVTLHFEGQVECAICYSIISASDGGLPKKACKTCRNRFHGGCLYKWFKTSHASTCPLCRSNII